MDEDLKSKATHLKDHVRDYVQTYVQLAKVKATKGASNAVSGIVIGVVAFFFAFFLFILSCVWIGMVVWNPRGKHGCRIFYGSRLVPCAGAGLVRTS